MKPIGMIYGDVIDRTFTFASKEYYEGDFVKVLSEETTDGIVRLVGEITKREIRNRYLTEPEAIKYISGSIDFQRDTIYMYTVNRIGVIRSGKLSGERMNAFPGKNVYAAAREEVRIVYGIKEDGQQIGYLKKMPSCPVVFDSADIFNPHLFIVGKTGSGKSYFVKHFISNIKDRFWIFSPSDEYDDMVSVSGAKKYTDLILDLQIDSISYYVNLNASEEQLLRKVDFKSDWVYSHKDMVEEITNYFRRKKTGSGQMTLNFDQMGKEQEVEFPGYANTLISKLRNIRHLKFSIDAAKSKLPDASMIFNIGDYTQLEQECILNYYLFHLMQRSKRTKAENRKKQIIIIEEAHNYVPSVRNTLSKEILVRLAREGRKYDISLCFITQRPRFFDQTALSQSSNRIIFSLPNPEDVKHVADEMTYYRPDVMSVVQGQKTGECMVVGNAFHDVLDVVVDFGK